MSVCKLTNLENSSLGVTIPPDPTESTCGHMRRAGWKHQRLLNPGSCCSTTADSHVPWERGSSGESHTGCSNRCFSAPVALNWYLNKLCHWMRTHAYTSFMDGFNRYNYLQKKRGTKCVSSMTIFPEISSDDDRLNGDSHWKREIFFKKTNNDQ